MKKTLAILLSSTLITACSNNTFLSNALDSVSNLMPTTTKSAETATETVSQSVPKAFQGKWVGKVEDGHESGVNINNKFIRFYGGESSSPAKILSIKELGKDHLQVTAGVHTCGELGCTDWRKENVELKIVNKKLVVNNRTYKKVSDTANNSYEAQSDIWELPANLSNDEFFNKLGMAVYPVLDTNNAWAGSFSNLFPYLLDNGNERDVIISVEEMVHHFSYKKKGNRYYLENYESKENKSE